MGRTPFHPKVEGADKESGCPSSRRSTCQVAVAGSTPMTNRIRRDLLDLAHDHRAALLKEWSDKVHRADEVE